MMKEKTEADFKSEGLEDHISKIRAEHHLDQRNKKIEMVENFLASGMLTALSQDISKMKPQQKSQSDVSHRSLGNNHLDAEFKFNQKLA